MSLFKSDAFQTLAGIGIGLAAPALIPALGTFVGGLFGGGAAAGAAGAGAAGAGGSLTAGLGAEAARQGAFAAAPAAASAAPSVANAGVTQALQGGLGPEAVASSALEAGRGSFFSDPVFSNLAKGVAGNAVSGMLSPKETPVAPPPTSVPSQAPPMPTMNGVNDPRQNYMTYGRGRRSLGL